MMCTPLQASGAWSYGSKVGIHPCEDESMSSLRQNGFGAFNVEWGSWMIPWKEGTELRAQPQMSLLESYTFSCGSSLITLCELLSSSLGFIHAPMTIHGSIVPELWLRREAVWVIRSIWFFKSLLYSPPVGHYDEAQRYICFVSIPIVPSTCLLSKLAYLPFTILLFPVPWHTNQIVLHSLGNHLKLQLPPFKLKDQV